MSQQHTEIIIIDLKSLRKAAKINVAKFSQQDISISCVDFSFMAQVFDVVERIVKLGVWI